MADTNNQGRTEQVAFMDDVWAAMERGDRPAERGWLVEWPATADQPVRWWHPEHGWTIDASRAIRFARKVDAEAYIKHSTRSMIGWAIATEHLWH